MYTYYSIVGGCQIDVYCIKMLGFHKKLKNTKSVATVPTLPCYLTCSLLHQSRKLTFYVTLKIKDCIELCIF